MRSSEAGWFMRIQHYQSEATTSMAARTTAFRRWRLSGRALYSNLAARPRRLVRPGTLVL